ncbi:hypothetical protein RvY_15749-2 [Ramazzottius varieornatus]|uniref:Uncharacterized protein n=1 Tax=Ramazzottius varieornatus TaxID=947166 RepID=A0A1D1W3U4_RAMVA|nr:hypothetical protein RvY_15749-2 [Ramazzottius varieornatus]
MRCLPNGGSFRSDAEGRGIMHGRACTASAPFQHSLQWTRKDERAALNEWSRISSLSYCGTVHTPSLKVSRYPQLVIWELRWTTSSPRLNLKFFPLYSNSSNCELYEAEAV